MNRAPPPLTQSFSPIALLRSWGRDRRGWTGNTALPQQTPADRLASGPAWKPVAWLRRALDPPGRVAQGNEPGLIERIEWLGVELLAVAQTSEPG